MSIASRAKKRCSKCGKNKLTTDFHKQSSALSGLAAACKTCHRKKYSPEYYREYYAQHREQRRKTSTTRSRRIKQEVFRHYGGKVGVRCRCCLTSEPAFLCIDHIHGGGTQHRKQIKQATYMWLWKSGLPEGYQILCWNCNAAKARHGTCPHEGPQI